MAIMLHATCSRRNRPITLASVSFKTYCQLIDLPKYKKGELPITIQLSWMAFRLPGGQARARRDTLVERRGKPWRKVMAIAEIFHRLREPVPPIWPDRARRVFIVIGSRVCAPLGHRVIYRVHRDERIIKQGTLWCESQREIQYFRGYFKRALVCGSIRPIEIDEGPRLSRRNLILLFPSYLS